MANEYTPKKKPIENGLGGLNLPLDTAAVNGSLKLPAVQAPTDWNARANSLADQLQNRGEFRYNPADDPLWQGMKDQYVQGGQRAMEDTMGQAAALTGGYNSSYAQSVGQQQYNDFMTKLTAQLPAAYDRARAAYDAEGDDLLRQLSVAQGMADTQYQRDRDALADQRYETEWNWQTEQAALDRERQSRLDAADQAYRDWQMGRAEAGDARDIALMMIQTGKMPSDDLLKAAGISSADAKAMSDFYAGQYAAQAAAAAGRSSGGGGYRYSPGGLDTTDTPQQEQARAAVTAALPGMAYGAAAGVAAGAKKPTAGTDVRNALLQAAQKGGERGFMQYYLTNIDGKYSNAVELYQAVLTLMKSMSGSGGGGNGNRGNTSNRYNAIM